MKKVKILIESLLQNILKNKLGGLDYKSKENLNTAKEVDLLTLPESIPGTNCFNCMYVTDIKDNSGNCSNDKVKLPVTNRMCCALWDNKDSLRSWENKK